MMWLQWWKSSVLMVCNILWSFTHSYMQWLFMYKLQSMAIL